MFYACLAPHLKGMTTIIAINIVVFIRHVMSYKWQRKDWGCELGENERIIDWSFLAELNFTLAALLTSKGKASL